MHASLNSCAVCSHVPVPNDIRVWSVFQAKDNNVIIFILSIEYSSPKESPSLHTYADFKDAAQLGALKVQTLKRPAKIERQKRWVWKKHFQNNMLSKIWWRRKNLGERFRQNVYEICVDDFVSGSCFAKYLSFDSVQKTHQEVNRGKPSAADVLEPGSPIRSVFECLSSLSLAVGDKIRTEATGSSIGFLAPTSVRI